MQILAKIIVLLFAIPLYAADFGNCEKWIARLPKEEAYLPASEGVRGIAQTTLDSMNADEIKKENGGSVSIRIRGRVDHRVVLDVDDPEAAEQIIIVGLRPKEWTHKQRNHVQRLARALGNQMRLQPIQREAASMARKLNTAIYVGDLSSAGSSADSDLQSSEASHTMLLLRGKLAQTNVNGIYIHDPNFSRAMLPQLFHETEHLRHFATGEFPFIGDMRLLEEGYELTQEGPKITRNQIRAVELVTEIHAIHAEIGDFEKAFELDRALALPRLDWDKSVRENYELALKIISRIDPEPESNEDYETLR